MYVAGHKQILAAADIACKMESEKIFLQPIEGEEGKFQGGFAELLTAKNLTVRRPVDSGNL